MKFPRVLHVGVQPIGAPGNTGLTLGTMFGGWPDDRLMQICLSAHSGASARGACLVAPSRTLPLDAALQLAMSRYGRVREHLRPNREAAESDGMNNATRPAAAPSLRQLVRSTVATATDIGPVWLPQGLVAAAAGFRPQVIHSLLGGVRIMRLTLALSERLRIPIVPHFMDDWVGTLFSDGQLHGYARSQLERVLGRILDRSPLCLTIGEDMRSQFESRLERPCFVVGNSVDIEDYHSLTANLSDDPCKVMRYVGGLHLARNLVIDSVAAALEATGGWRLELYVPDHDQGRAGRLAGRFTCVSYCGSLKPSEVPQALATSHALVFVESDASAVADFTRLSVSTKVPQYLASGRPTLVLGPGDQSSVRTLRRGDGCVYPGPRPSSEELRSSIADLTSVVDQQRTQPPGAHPAWFIEEFGHAATRERLRCSLALASAGVTAGHS